MSYEWTILRTWLDMGFSPDSASRAARNWAGCKRKGQPCKGKRSQPCCEGQSSSSSSQVCEGQSSTSSFQPCCEGQSSLSQPQPGEGQSREYIKQRHLPEFRFRFRLNRISISIKSPPDRGAGPACPGRAGVPVRGPRVEMQGGRGGLLFPASQVLRQSSSSPVKFFARREDSTGQILDLLAASQA